ncbi:MAG: TetR/AcrR family transcriptional regulator [Opitutae bacterium]|nr:TetR/AcrR family transcriptional regulator [Opitutae bacterium]
MNPSAEPSAPASAKREHLLDTAWELFCQSGYRAVGIDTLLAKAGVAKMTLYNHFGSKEDLIAAAMEKKGEEILAGFDATIAAAGKSPTKRLSAVFDWLEGWFSSADFAGCAFVKAIGEYRLDSDKPRRAATAFKQALQQRIEALCGEAELRNAPALARQFMLLIDGATVHADLHRRSAYAQDARAAARALIESASRV